MPLPVYSSAAELYRHAGWTAVIPVGPEDKGKIPTGFTGYEGRDTTAADIAAWSSNGRASHNIGLRMPMHADWCVIGIDVDHYTTRKGVVKTGGDTYAACEARLGVLPGTWTSTARGAVGPSRIRFFRVPAGVYRTVIQPHIEIIQRHHRFAVVWPSIHEETGTTYEWYTPAGVLAHRLPSPEDFPELTEQSHGAWLAFLREGAASAGPVSAPYAAGEALLARLSLDMRTACSRFNDSAEKAARELAAAEVNTRHDSMTARVHGLVIAAAYGHAGFGAAVTALREHWAKLTAGEGREAEFERMLLTSARKAVTLTGGMELPDTCESEGGHRWDGVAAPQVDTRPRPVDNRPAPEDPEQPNEPLTQALPPRLVDPSWKQVIGAQPFEPGVELDQQLADTMLLRAFPMVRRASDTKSSWLLRGAEQWTLEGDLGRRIVSECAELIPVGDPTPVAKGEEPSPAQRSFKLRKRMQSNGPASAVGSMIKAVTDGGRHPATVRLEDLDVDPDIIWAGGYPWNLRESHTDPAAARHVRLDTPHLTAAGVTPLVVSTPRWDAFLSAVWPDEPVRRWCLRVLSIACSGYPDAALPILYGEGGTGKTSLITLIMEVLGTYAHAANPKLLSADADQFMTFTLKGRRLSFIDEAMREGHRNAETLKQLTGGGMLTGAAKYQGEITFPATHTLVLTSNTEPSVHDQAIRRRVRLLPCNGDPTEVRARRQELSSVWAAEAPGVLAMLMREAAGWLTDPDSALTAAAPASIQTALDSLTESQDVVGQWLAESVIPHDHGTRARSLFTGFLGWCRDGNVHRSLIPTETAWGRALTERGYDVIPRRDGKYRPLVIRGDGGFTPPSPSPPPGEDSWRVGGGLLRVGGGFEGQPATPHMPSSGPGFAGSVAGVSGSSTNLKTENVEIGQKRELGERFGNGPQPATELNGAAASTPCDLGEEQKSRNSDNPPQAEEPATAQSALPIDLDPSRKVTASEVAKVADDRGITKTAARELIKTETRRSAIETASGPTVPLPAAVDRAGVITPLTHDEARQRVAAVLQRSPALTVDVEHSGYPVGHRLYHLRLVQLGDKYEAVVFDATRHDSLVQDLLAGDFPLIAHSASADLVPLDHARIIDPEQAWDRMHDTVIPAKLADPSSTGSDPGLKELSPAMLGADSAVAPADAARLEVWKAAGWRAKPEFDTPPELNGWTMIQHDCATMVRYAASDVLDTAAIAEKLAPLAPPTHIYERERLTERLTARVSHQGVALDLDHIRALEVKHTALRAEADVWLRAQGMDNPGSDRQVAQKLAELGVQLPRTKPSKKFPEGQLSVAEGVLDPIVDEGGPAAEFARQVLIHREHSTALSLFLRPYKVLCEHGDGRARPTVYTLGTNTGRMSCVRPNMQQLPRAGGFRAMVTADPGEMMISADFSGVELRVAAALSGDPALTQLIASGGDLHAEVALMVFNDPDPVASAKRGRPWPKKAHRYKVKSGVFGRLYGGGAPTLAGQMGVRLDVAQRMIDVLDDMLPTLSAWSNHMRKRVQRGDTQFQAYNGRVIHLPAAFPHKAPNYGIQGNARELLVDALVNWSQTKWGKCRLLPVHDEIDVWVPAEDAEEATRTLMDCMATELYGVKIVAEPSEPSYAWQDSE